MPMRQHQFTIWRLMMLIAAIAIYLAYLRIFDPTITIVTAVVLGGFLIDRRRNGTGILGGTFAGGILFLVGGAATYFDPNVAAGYVGPVMTLPAMFVAGLMWGLAWIPMQKKKTNI
jgi:hypothetical protein